MNIESDLVALRSLPPATLQRLIDPAATPKAAPPPPGDQLRGYDGSSVEQSVDASKAYVTQMHGAESALKANVIGERRDIDGEKLEKIRSDAEEVRKALEEYRDKTV